jgi:hypothetical protein
MGFDESEHEIIDWMDIDLDTEMVDAISDAALPMVGGGPSSVVVVVPASWCSGMNPASAQSQRVRISCRSRWCLLVTGVCPQGRFTRCSG